MDIYHGSNKIIEKPMYGVGKESNDYGLGFYCTQFDDLAGEWAVSELCDGYVNHYEIDLDALEVLALNNGNYHILNWLAILLDNRKVDFLGDISKQGYEYIINEFLIDYNHFDVIRGYRADDSYFSFARAFLNNTISLETLNTAMYLGMLGEQIVLKSKKAFDKIKYVDNEVAHRNFYFSRKITRDIEARGKFSELLKSGSFNQTYLLDIIRGGWKNDDARIQRIIY